MKYIKINTAKGIKANQEFVEFKQIQLEEDTSTESQIVRDYDRAWEDDRI
ncbi:hypothetical protein RGU12_00160 [Fredinandcohnia sp. QZ13]|nr:hypothetical protein [Fredinandcohnia sp. QZ13]MDR4885956.1 hypothetical protein [Fredinandcohnia sp. QZ13]